MIMWIKFYKYFSNLLSLPIFFFFLIRLFLSKETISSICEKFSFYYKKRPKGDLIWINAVSIGESKTGIIIAKEIKKIKPNSKILLTTTTLTAYKLLSEKNSEFLIIFFPLDIHFVVRRFLEHWKPSSAIFVESEIWPNILYLLKQKSIKLSIFNGRISQKSFENWRRVSFFSQSIFSLISQCFVQDNDSLRRFKILGVRQASKIENLKFLSKNLEVDEIIFNKLSSQLKLKQIVILFSSHDDEEKMFIQCHQDLSKKINNLFFIIVPRHINRVKKITEEFNKKKIAYLLKSKGELKVKNENFLIVDTFGELGVFFKLSNIAVVGGSFSSNGGHNPIETKDFNCSLIFGPHMENFGDIRDKIISFKAGFEVKNSHQLLVVISQLLKNKELNKNTHQNFKKLCEIQANKSKSILKSLLE